MIGGLIAMDHNTGGLAVSRHTYLFDNVVLTKENTCIISTVQSETIHDLGFTELPITE